MKTTNQPPLLDDFNVYVQAYRNGRTLREAAKEIGISAPTLQRVEAGRLPDLRTFGKLCAWMRLSPAEFLNYKRGAAAEPMQCLQLTIPCRTAKEKTQLLKTLALLANAITCQSNKKGLL